MEITALIMAGGRGERFWPKSRRSLPKQFLDITGCGSTMLQLTVRRVLPLVKIQNIFVATNKSYKSLVLEQLPDLPCENILCENVPRNTAPCIAVGAALIQKKFGDALMLVLPSDHVVKNEIKFLEIAKTLSAFAEGESSLFTFGISPAFPETGYGYIKFNPQKIHEKNSSVFFVERFVEKPPLQKAKEYLESGSYLWNSGMFFWKASSILQNVEKFLPEIFSSAKKIASSYGCENYEKILEEEFFKMPSESIDYGVMEKASQVWTIPCDFGWDDVGSWLSLERMNAADADKNVVQGNAVFFKSRSNIVLCEKKLVAAVGVENLIVVDTKDAILVCKKENASDIKKILEELKNSGREEFL